MSGFKLLAIIPLKGCDEKYRKSLEIGTYQFYQNYDIKLNADKSEVLSVTPEETTVPDDLYTLENGINLNFSAVVGKNGTGKSALFELLYYLIYVIGTEKEIAGDKIISAPSSDMLRELKELKGDFILLNEALGDEPEKSKSPAAICNHFIKKHKLNIGPDLFPNDLSFFKKVKIELEGKAIALDKVTIKKEKEKEQKIKEGLNLSVVYSVDEAIFELNFQNQEFQYFSYEDEHKKKGLDIKQFNLNQFFYNISINYSHHALNSKTLGKWITKLFHKNDAYTTPVVINPMRDEGNFNINIELNLSKERLMANLVYELVQKKTINLLGKYSISSFIFKPKSSSRSLSNDPSISHSRVKKLIELTTGIKNFDKKKYFWISAIWYLESKIRRIERNYPLQIQQFAQDNGIEKEDSLEFFLRHDQSHITKKVRQTMNFLKASSQTKKHDFWKYKRKGNSNIDKTPKELLKWIDESVLNRISEAKKESMNPSELIEHALPGFFNIDFELMDDNKKVIKFSALSSGEQQMILNINAISYHLYNLQSIHYDNPKLLSQGVRIEVFEEKSRTAYSNVNIILDEVELYYHPEMQRMLVKELRKSFENVKRKGEKGITSINVCILTHSPFILSDIPRENVLLLKAKEDKNLEISKDQTFASNIHDLLSNGFFMKTLMGQFAEDKIAEVIKRIENKDTTDSDEQIIKLIGDSFLKAGVEQFKADQND